MKKLTAAILCISFLFAHAKMEFQFDHTITKVKATVHVMDNGQLYVIVPADNPNQRYIADNMPQEFKKDSLAVTISGNVGKIPPNVRMMGTPLHLKCICITSADKKKHQLKKKKYTFK